MDSTHPHWVFGIFKLRSKRVLRAPVDGDAEDVRRLLRSLRGVGREQVEAMFARYYPLGELGAEAQQFLVWRRESVNVAA